MRIRIIAVGQVAKEKTFYVLPITFEANGKTQDKKIFSFSEKAYSVLKDAKEGQFYEVTLEKDKNGYWQWVGVELSAQTAPAAASSGGNSRGFETPEERARRQVMIVRQSSLERAMEYHKIETPVGEILQTAETFEDWVMRD